jgi:hypothetical protein
MRIGLLPFSNLCGKKYIGSVYSVCSVVKNNARTNADWH